jgi:predicted CoA-binding protein
MSTQADGLNDGEILGILDNTRRIAVVGFSGRPDRASHGVARYLARAGFSVAGINPSLAGQEIEGIPVYASLGDVPGNIDLVDVFRREDAIPGVTDEVLRLANELGIHTLWLQLGLVDEASADRARAGGIAVVMDRCLKVEHARLMPGAA